MAVRKRVFNIMQYEKHPVTGEELLNETKIIQALGHKTFREWAYIAHTEDVYSSDDEERDYKAVVAFYNAHSVEQEKGRLTKIPEAYTDRDKLTEQEYVLKYQTVKAGQKKPKHWHIVARSDTPVDVNTVARWFGIAPQYVDLPNGQGAFMDCIEYLVHEGKKAISQGKYHYDDICVKANFDFRSRIDEMAEKRAKFGKDLSEKDEIRYKVLYEGLSIAELCSTPQGQLAYQDDYSTLDKFRLKYIQERATMPEKRINYYICGGGGIGKNLMCKALARSLYPDIKNEEDIYFEVGTGKTTFEGYDGQPVIIWNDFRAKELLKTLGGRGNVFKVFEMFPSRSRQNIKYGSITLTNEINIVNSVQEWKDFLDGLAGNYTNADGEEIETAEDVGQSYRRFPMIMPLHESDFDLLINKGVIEGTREYTQYQEYLNIRGSMQRIATQLSGNMPKRREIEAATVKPVIEKHKELSESITTTTMTDEEIEAEFGNYGKQVYENTAVSRPHVQTVEENMLDDCNEEALRELETQERRKKKLDTLTYEIKDIHQGVQLTFDTSEDDDGDLPF